ncbi:Putative oxidoreductase YghA OS=Streptomyces griseorubiginosus OX=67304 GN=yghA PE=3 SV=1 [Streptomyces griseorubiginosus]
MQPEQERSAPQVVSEPDPPYDSDKQQRPGLEADMRTRPRYRASRYRASGKLEGKAALITGGDSGVGRAVALLYAREGADVAIVYLPEERVDAEQVRREVEEQGRRCLLLPGHLRGPEFCREAVERTAAELGGLNILVSNAAYLNSKLELDQLTAEDFDGRSRRTSTRTSTCSWRRCRTWSPATPSSPRPPKRRSRAVRR